MHREKEKKTSPPAPWMKDEDIGALQNQRNKLRYEAQSKRARSAWVGYRKVRNEIKPKLNSTKTSFDKKNLNSKNTKGIRRFIHRIPNPKSTTLKGNLNDINKFVNSTAERVAGKESVETSNIYRTITSLRENNYTELFELQTKNSDEVLKNMKRLHRDCSTGYGNIPIFTIKAVAECISSPLAFVINNQILTRTFSKKWKISRICPIPIVNKPET